MGNAVGGCAGPEGGAVTTHAMIGTTGGQAYTLCGRVLRGKRAKAIGIVLWRQCKPADACKLCLRKEAVP